ncbi:hypothetical protein AB0911_36355 [Streptomyces nigra]|uniref:hypothetical protein n=1 Tax=Streptomyces nigra TaxID=1827580 RepID=UPI0034572C6F
MTRPEDRPDDARGRMLLEDDPLFDADLSRCPSGTALRASITVADIERINRMADEAAGVTA